jgi:hypothetical protein
VVRSSIGPLVLFSFLGAGCLELSLSDPGDAGASPPAASAGAADATGVISGTACAVDSLSKMRICTSIDLCPGLLVDHDLYPDCGFRVPAFSIDLECICGDSVCSMGTALSCAQAKALLASGSELTVCTQEADGRCALRGR